jgi:antitoxin ParD1/3/4/toxin ParE1/3/4
MSLRFLLTPAARSDLIQIDEYLRRESVQAAARVRTRLREAMRCLAERPGMGHLREDLGDEKLRFWPVYSYLIIYRPDIHPLQVVRVLHASRDIQRLLGVRPQE